MYSVARRSTRTPAGRAASRGLSLLEALAATGILSVALLGLGASSVDLTRRGKTSDSVAAASALAVQKLEQLRSMPLGASQLTPGQYYDPGNNLKADGTTGGPYNRSWQVSVKDTPTFGLKTVTVTVSWKDSKQHETEVAAYVRCSTVPCP